MFFTFPEDARWNAERQAVEFGVEIGEYRGVVRVPRWVFPSARAAHPRSGVLVEASLLSTADPATADPVREHCRTEDPTAAVD